MNIALFVYNFPHKKSQDFLWRLLTDGIKPKIVLAANPVELNIPKSTLRVKPRHISLVHPKAICKTFKIDYCIVDHNSKNCTDLLSKYSIDIGVIAGARILKKRIIDATKIGILNFHPGLIPDIRGLEALQWAIYRKKPLGVTSHLIDERIDAGFIIEKRIIPEYPDDSFQDLSLRLYETQLDMILNAIEKVKAMPISEFPLVGKSTYHTKMPIELERKLPGLLKKRLSSPNGINNLKNGVKNV